jgi:exodeoxyribonuclease V beta subunit
MADECAKLTTQQMTEQLQAFSSSAKGDISVVPLPSGNDAAALPLQIDAGKIPACREFTSRIDTSWRVASFTSFAAHGGATAELPDRDAIIRHPENIDPSVDLPQHPSIFTFQKGAQAGIFLHGIFEELDFADCSHDEIRRVSGKCIESYGYDTMWLPAVCRMVDNVTRVPLKSSQGVFSLADIEAGKWLTEFEFFFPLKFVTTIQMKECLNKWSGASPGIDLAGMCRTLGFKPVQGVVRGFMDMVFEHDGRYYLVDWKSNHLGYRVEDYGQEMLKREMERNLYPLQYLLYTVALNRYLSLRVKDYQYARHFGGIIYLFIRGIDPEHGEKYGVFRDIPPEGLISELTDCLIETGG